MTKFPLERIIRAFAPVMLAIPMFGFVLPADACSTIINWYADLKGANDTPAGAHASPVGLTDQPAVSTPATGRVEYVFNFEQPQATVNVDTHKLRDVRSVEIRVAGGDNDLGGPTILSLYNAKSGPYSDKFNVTVTDADVIKSDTPKVAGVQDLAGVVSNGMAVVVICTKAHPLGELAGRITMHKSEVYSDDPNSRFHDPALHHAHDAAVATGTAPETPASPSEAPTPTPAASSTPPAAPEAPPPANSTTPPAGSQGDKSAPPAFPG